MNNTSNKTLQDLTLKDNFMFAAVMLEPDNCKPLLEMVIGIKISAIYIDKEKCLIYHPDYHGIRLDVYAADEQNTHYNIEMQARKCKSIKKRARYYGSQMDMEMLNKGLDYENLPDSYIVFVCDYDPFDEEKYVYTQKKVCVESPTVDVDDGCHTIYLSTVGKNKKETPDELVNFLEYVRKPLKESEEECEDAYVRQLQDTVRRIKADREMGARYMTFQQLIKDERKEAFEEGQATERVNTERERQRAEEAEAQAKEAEAEIVRLRAELERLKK